MNTCLGRFVVAFMVVAGPVWGLRNNIGSPAASVDSVHVQKDAADVNAVFSVGTTGGVGLVRTVFSAAWTSGSVFNEPGRAGADFRVESDTGDSALVVDAGGDSLFSDVRAHFRGVLYGRDDVHVGDDLFIYSSGGVVNFNSGDVTITHAANDLILAGGDFTFQDAVALSLGTGDDSQIEYNGTNTLWNLRAVGAGNLLLNNGIVFIGDGTTTTHAGMTIGLYVDQRAADDMSLGAGSSDVAHGVTSLTGPTTTGDTYFHVSKNQAATGGARIVSIAENAASEYAMAFYAFGGQASSVQTSAAIGLVEFYVSQHNGANAAADIAANGVAYAFRGRVGGANRSLFIIDEDGDFLYDGADGGAYALFDDPGILYALENETARPGEMVLRAGERWLQYQKEDLMRLGVLSQITPEEEAQGHRSLVNGAVLDKVHTGGIVQNAVKIDFLGERVWTIDEVLDSLRTENRTLHQRVAVLERHERQGPTIFERSY